MPTFAPPPLRCAARRRPGWLVLCLAGAVSAAGQNPAAGDRVTFFTEPNFRGEALTVEAGAAVPNLGRIARAEQRPWLFAISSVRVEGGARATVHSSPDFTGDRLDIIASIADLYAEPRGTVRGNNWDRAIASVAVSGPRATVVAPPPGRFENPPPGVHVVPAPPAGRYDNSPAVVRAAPAPAPVVRPPPPRYDARTADAMIQRAYQEVFLRAADPAGLRHYRQKLMGEGWSEKQLISDLQRSREARAIDPGKAIAQAYQDELGREPDPSGLAHYRKLWRDGWTQGAIRRDMRRSDEGRERQIKLAVTRAYQELLGREPDPEGYATYEKLMRKDGYTEQDVRRAIMAGEEYRQRRGKKR